MDSSKETNYMKGFLPYALAAFLVGIIGGLSTVLGCQSRLNFVHFSR